MTDNTDVLGEVDGVHLCQCTSARDGFQDTHRHRHLHVALDGTGGMLFDKHREGRNQHRVELAGNALGETVIVGGDHTELLVLHPLLKGYDIFRHVPDLFDGAATLDVERVEDILCLRTDSVLIGDIVGNRPHLLPVELLRIDKHTVIEVGLVDIEIHHTRVGATDLGDIGVTETATHLSRTAPVLYLCLSRRIAALYNAGNHCRALAGTVQVGYHLTDSAAGIELTQPGGNVGLGIIGCQLLLQVHNHHRHVEVADGGQHIIRGAVGEHLQNDQIDICCTELITGCHRLLLTGDHTAIDDLDGIGQRLLERFILGLELGNELRELWQVCLQGNREYTYLCFGFY